DMYSLPQAGSSATATPITDVWIDQPITAPVAILSVAPTTISGTAFAPLSNMSVATFTRGVNTDPAASFSATINWGDGTSPTAGTVVSTPTGYAVLGSHTYQAVGVFHVSVTVTGSGTGSGAESTASIG